MTVYVGKISLRNNIAIAEKNDRKKILKAILFAAPCNWHICAAVESNLCSLNHVDLCQQQNEFQPKVALGVRRKRKRSTLRSVF